MASTPGTPIPPVPPGRPVPDLPAPAGMPRWLPWTLAVLLGGLLLLALSQAARRWGHRPDGGSASTVPDPRLTYDGPYLNVRPDVAFVGDAACARCHLGKAESYRKHPMGRSLAPLSAVVEQPPHATPGSRFTALGSLFEIHRRGEQVWHRQTRLDEAGQPIYTHELEARFVVGSGTRGYSYLAERDGFLFQTPMSWFSQKGVWDLSPGFAAALVPGRPISPDCLFCHSNRVRPREETVHGYEKPIFEGHAIGCERCHGPGERHVKAREKQMAVEGAVDTTIVHPGKLAPALREAVCEQCHLMGESRVLRRGREVNDYRPGLPLQHFWSIFVKDQSSGSARAVSHVEQMYLSRCYQQSAGPGKLGCVSCHDPHERVAPEKRADHYRARCLHCHQERGCTEPREKRLKENAQDSCIACHMPTFAAADIVHTAGTDHRIVRRRTGPPGREEGTAQPPVPFYRDGLEAREQARDLGVALARLAAEGKGDIQANARKAAELLRGSIDAFPDDLVAIEARGQALATLGRHAEALATFEEVLVRSPRRERSLWWAAVMAENTGARERALGYWRRAVEVNPTAAGARGSLAQLLARAGAWSEVREHCQAWLRLDPGSIEARKLWIRYLLQRGERKEANAERDRLRRLQ